ncbi:MAG: APC family permease [Alphaproteobacteria bacterium]|jgi:amino acid transporter|nr:APC family permease [Alphaproteobacteria bacterium]MDP6515375.1 APC family permease [Alphaproteobacteria bacterium]
MSDPASLKRSLSLPLVTLYGLGTTIGAGIYVLVGKVAERAGMLAPMSFLVALLLAALTAFSFAELAARYPRSAGEAVYIREGLRVPAVAVAVGLLVAFAGIASAAAIANGFVGYLGQFVTTPETATVALLVLALGLTAAWGIAQSVTIAAILTVVEIVGLVMVIAGAGDSLTTLPDRIGELVPSVDGAAWLGILGGAVLAFYAFLGFEDMVNVAEEVTDVTHTLPRAIILTLIATGLLYIALSVVAVLAVPVADLAASEAPLALIFARTTGMSPAIIVVIALFSVINGALIQVIMASRVIYGMAAQGWLPRGLAKVSPRTRTPLWATALVTALVMTFALLLPLVTLAELTSMTTLVIFCLVNLALWRIKSRAGGPVSEVIYPKWIPVVGFLVSGALAMFQVAVFLG